MVKPTEGGIGTRFEDGLEIWCCGGKARLFGNYSLREAGASRTSLGYRCPTCQRTIVVSDAPYGGGPPDPEVMAALDQEP